MILCFALGIANLFTINVLIIILSAICLYAPLSLPYLSPLTKTPNVSQLLLLRNPLHRSPPAPAHLPDLGNLRHLHPQDHDQLPARGRLRRHGRRPVADAAARRARHLAAGRRRVPQPDLYLLRSGCGERPGVCREQDAWWGWGGADDCIR